MLSFIEDWRGQGRWTPMQRRRKADLMSALSTWTEPPIPGVPCLLAWSYGVLTQSAPGVWIFGGDNPGHAMSAQALFEANDWHLINGIPRMVNDGPIGGGQTTYAVDMRIPECADAMADMITVNFPANSDWAAGVHIDWFNVPTYLPDFAEFANDAQFIADWTAGMARMVNRIRANRPSWIIIGQTDHRADASMEDGLNGYFLEQFIGAFSSQTSFPTVQGWITAHAALLAANHPGRQQRWIINYRYPYATGPAAFGMTRDAHLQAHVDLCNATGSVFAYGLAEGSQYQGHSVSAGKASATKTLRPSGRGSSSQWAPASNIGNASNFGIVSDGQDGTAASTTLAGARDAFTVAPLAEPRAEGILDVSVNVRSAVTGLAATVRPYYAADGNNAAGRNRSLVSGLANAREDFVVHPSGADWTLASLGTGFELGYESIDASPLAAPRVADLSLDVIYEYTPTVAPTSDVMSGSLVLPAGEESSLVVRDTEDGSISLAAGAQSAITL